ncbi:MAG: hypothetical protein GC189_14290 [Alphaproteobacteria bacterium]|nr:hypothetical protein [Alphaproteobacteria bacterium]
MATPPGKAPILETASAGLRYAVQNWRANVPASAIGAIAMAVLGYLTLRAGAGANVGAALLTQIFGLAVTGALYGFFVRGALGVSGSAAPGGVAVSIARVIGAMIVVGFFLFIVTVVMGIVALVILATAIAPYAADFEAAQRDPQATMAVFERVMEANPFPFLLVGVVFAFVWMALTSRLYLAAPASVAEGRVMSFDTWRWTKGNMLRIIAARLILLAPIFVVVVVVQGVLGLAFGADPGDPAALERLAQSPVAYLVQSSVSNFVTFALLYAAEAGLSTYLYRGLRPPDAPG